MKPDGPPALLRPRTPLDRPAPNAKAALDRLAAALPDGQRKPSHPTFNSAV